MANVRIENATKIFPGDVKAVQEVDLEVQDHEFVVLVGPSGCGKSTMLRIVAGLEAPTAGSVYIDDKKMNDTHPKDRDIAMVFQDYALYPHMTVYKNMAFGLKLRRLPKKKIDELVRYASRILGIEELLERKPKALSGGQRQRVAVGRAIVRQPSVFLFDEPLSNLDAKMRVQMRTEISKLHTRLNATIIYVTHDQVEAMTMGNRICVINKGLIQQIDSPMEVYNNPANKFVAGFIGSPPMNFFEGSLEGEGDALYFSSTGVRVRIPSDKQVSLEKYKRQNLIMGIRPESIRDVLYTSNPDPTMSVEARIEVIEPMGSETLLYLTAKSQTFTARVDSHEKNKVGQSVKLAFDMPNARFFDCQTEKLIT